MLKRNPNGMAVVAQIPKSVNTNRQEVLSARRNSVFSSPSTSLAHVVRTTPCEAVGRKPNTRLDR